VRSVDRILAEHRLIERMLRVVEDCAGALERGGDVPASVPRDAVVFLALYADAVHHAKEEEVFFPALAAHGIAPEGSAVGALQAQHEAGRALVARLRAAVQGLEAGERGAGAAFAGGAREYVALLREHIAIEDRLFVEYAEDCLSPAEDAALDAAMERLDRLRPEAGGRERFERLVERCEGVATRC
jgi:hemerythrin-like domain-containing protein